MKYVLRYFIAGLVLCACVYAAQARFGKGQGAYVQTIGSITYSGATATPGLANTPLGSASVTMFQATPVFSGTCSLSGANASSFTINSSTCALRVGAANLAFGVYSFNIVATEAGITNSPLSLPVSIGVPAWYVAQSTRCANANGGSGTQATCALPKSYTGDTLVVMPDWCEAAPCASGTAVRPSTVTINNGTATCTEITGALTPTSGSAIHGADAWLCPNLSAAADSVKVVYPSSVGRADLNIQELYGCSPACVAEGGRGIQIAAPAGSSPSISLASATTAAFDFVLSFLGSGDGAGLSAGACCTALTGDAGNLSEYQVGATAQSYTNSAAYTGSALAYGTIAAFKQTTSPPLVASPNVISPTSFSVVSNAPAGTLVGTITATTVPNYFFVGEMLLATNVGGYLVLAQSATQPNMATLKVANGVTMTAGTYTDTVQLIENGVTVNQNFTLTVTSPQTIASITCSGCSNSFTANTPNGVVGTVTVTMSPASPAFSGTLSITGSNSGAFQLSGTSSGSNLLQSSIGTPAGTYTNTNIVATQAGIGNSPQQITPTLTGVAATVFAVNLGDVRQTIDGFGGSDIFSSDWRPYADQLFCVNGTDPGCTGTSGIGLTYLRTATEAGAGEIPYAQTAAARGVTVWASPLGPNGATVTDSSTYHFMSDAIVSFINLMKSNGISIYAISSQNEPDCGCNAGGVIWSAAQTAALDDELGPILHGLSPSVKLLSPEVAFPDQKFNSYHDAIVADSTANGLVDIWSTHQYGNILLATPDSSRRTWENEFGDGGGVFSTTIADAVSQLASVHDALNYFNVTAWHYFWLSNDTSGKNDQLLASSGASSIYTKRYFGLGNWSRFVRPGWVRVGVQGSQSGIYGATAFKNPSTGQFAIVAINNSGSDIPNVSFSVAGTTMSSVTPYVTSGTALGALGSDGNLSAGSASSGIPASIPISSGAFTSTVPYGITTFVGSSSPPPGCPTAPAMAALGGFTTNALCADFTTPTYANPNTFVDACGATGNNLWRWVYFIGGSGQKMPCGDITMAADSGVTPTVPQVLNITVATGDWPFICGQGNNTPAGCANGTTFEFPSYAYHDPCTGTCFPYTMFTEVTFRIPAAGWDNAPTAQQRAHVNYVLNGTVTAGGSTFIEPDYYESTGNGRPDGSFGVTTVINNVAGFGHGLDIPNLDMTAYHTLSYLTTSNGSSDIRVCMWIDNVFEFCHPVMDFTPGSPTYTQHDNSIAMNIGDFQSTLTTPQVNMVVLVKKISVWACSAWATNMCNGSILYGQDAQGLAYWHN